jgi:hypothetical protein
MTDYPTAHLNLPAGEASVRVPALLALGLLLALLAGSLPAIRRIAVRRRAERQRKASLPVTVPPVPWEIDLSCR